MNLEMLKLENRRTKIIAAGKYVKCPGALRKVNRQLRNIQKEQTNAN